MTPIRTSLALITFALAQSAAASLVWEQTQLDLHPKPGDATAVGSFKYRNTGKQPVHIKSVHTSCGCTTTSQKKDTVQPGEAGEITATFKIGTSTGLQQKTVQVETDDADQPVTVLTLRATVPQLLEVQPSFVYWESNAEAKPKTINVKLAKEANADNVKVSSSSPEFETKVIPAGPNEFKVEVQPHDTSRPSNATLTITPNNGGRPAYATARVITSSTQQ